MSRDHSRPTTFTFYIYYFTFYIKKNRQLFLQ